MLSFFPSPHLLLAEEPCALLTNSQEFERVSQSINEQFNEKTPAQRKAEMHASRRAKQNALREREGLPLLPPIAAEPGTEGAVEVKSKPQLVEVVERNGWESDFGFVLFRTDYTDESAWERFEEVFNKLVDESVAAEVPGSERKWVEEGVVVKMVVDDTLEGAQAEDVAR